MAKHTKHQDQTDYKILCQRTLADFENYKKRVEAEKAIWTDQAKIDFLHKLLPVLDNLVLMANHQPEDLKDNSWAQGVALVSKQIEDTLAEEGVEKIEASAGDDFDPNYHEAVGVEENKRIAFGKITKLQKPGYKIGDKIVRVAKVLTSK